MNKIAIFSVPRSGSSWLGQIFNSSPNVLYRFQPNFAYSFNKNLIPNASSEEINNFFEDLITSKDAFVNAKISISGKPNIIFQKSEIDALVFKETHYLHVIENLIKNSNVKIVGLIRSPLATLNSWLRTPREFNSNWEIVNEWKDAPSKNLNKEYNYFGYNKWKEAANLFLNLKAKYPNKVILVRYEDLLKNPEEITKTLFDFFGLSFDNQTNNFIVKSTTTHQIDAYSVYKVKQSDDSWKQLPNYIINYILKDLKNTNLEPFLNE